MLLLHVTEGWDGGPIEASPFLHLCTEAQLPFVLRRHFAGRTDLSVLRIDPAGLDVRWEVSEPGMHPFPHLYGPLPAAAVLGYSSAGSASGAISSTSAPSRTAR